MFDGRASRRHINLGGRNAKSETREQVLARTRAEREARARQKLERRSANRIQARAGLTCYLSFNRADGWM